MLQKLSTKTIATFHVSYVAAMERTVGAALRGRPCVEFNAGAATEGRPYTSVNDFVELFQALEFPLRLDQDWDVPVGVLPEREEILVRRARPGRVALHH